MQGVPDLLEGDRAAVGGYRGALLLGGGKAVAEAFAFGLAKPDGELGRRDRLVGRLGAYAEVLVE